MKKKYERLNSLFTEVAIKYYEAGLLGQTQKKSRWQILNIRHLHIEI